MKKLMSYLLVLLYSPMAFSYSFSRLTILTKPIGQQGTGYQGHPSVNRSLFQGLSQLGVRWNIDPTSFNELGDVVLVLSNLNTLLQGIELKKMGRIKKLILGPNMMEQPSHLQRVPADINVDLCLVPSEWVKLLFHADEPRLIGRVTPWFAGVDHMYWCPTKNNSDSKKVLVYWKTESETFCRRIEEYLKQYGWNPIRIKYHSHTQPQYKELLSQVRFAVFVSKSETQGIALAEAWSMNVPTIIWNPGEHYNHGMFYKDISACPYLTPATGIAWETFEEFNQIIHHLPELLNSFYPREWVLSHMTDEISAHACCDSIESTFRK